MKTKTNSIKKLAKRPTDSIKLFSYDESSDVEYCEARIQGWYDRQQFLRSELMRAVDIEKVWVENLREAVKRERSTKPMVTKRI